MSKYISVFYYQDFNSEFDMECLLSSLLRHYYIFKMSAS